MKKITLTLPCALVVLAALRLHPKIRHNFKQWQPHHHDRKAQNDQGVYIVKDAMGQKGYVPAGRVREIAPASEVVEEDKSRFNPTKR